MKYKNYRIESTNLDISKNRLYQKNDYKKSPKCYIVFQVGSLANPLDDPVFATIKSAKDYIDVIEGMNSQD